MGHAVTSSLEVGRAIAVSLGLLAASLTCGSAKAQNRGGSLQWIMGAEPEILAPYFSVSPVAAQVGAKIYDGLLDYDEDRRPVPALAERWEIAPDGRSITFHLRRDVVFHDGQPFTSADVRFSILEVLRRHHARGAVVFRSVTAIETPDPLTAIIQLSEPAPHLLAALAGHESPMLPRHALGPVLATHAKTQVPLAQATLVVGNGPFKLASRTVGQGVRLVRHARYWRQGLPLLDTIDIQFASDDNARAALAEHGGAHLVSGLDTQTAQRLKTSVPLVPRLDGARSQGAIAVLSLNTSRHPFDKIEVRQAVALAIDRPQLIASVWHGFARPASGPFPDWVTGPEPGGIAPAVGHTAVEKSRHEPGHWRRAAPTAIERANVLLDAAGLPRREDGFRFVLVHDVAPLGPEWQRLGEAIELQLARVGIKVSSRFETIEAWMQRLSGGGDFDLASHAVYGFSDPAISLHRTLHGGAASSPSPFSNTARWRNREVDALLDRAQVELDVGRRQQAYRQVGEMAREASPVVWLVELTPPVLAHPTVQRIMMAPLGLHGNFAEAYIASSGAPGPTVDARPVSSLETLPQSGR
jgi:peptide/nickel transport system substrate-binding protein